MCLHTATVGRDGIRSVQVRLIQHLARLVHTFDVGSSATLESCTLSRAPGAPRLRPLARASGGCAPPMRCQCDAMCYSSMWHCIMG